MTLRGRRALSLVGTMLAADGLTFASHPAGQIRLWSSGRAPRWYQRMMRFWLGHQALCRLLGGAEIIAGTLLLRRAARAV